MEENNNIDDIFRSALDDLKMEPSSSSWENISTDLNKKRSARGWKKRGLWFSAAAFLLIVGYTAFKFTAKQTVSTQEKIQQTETIPHASTSPSVNQDLQSPTADLNNSAPIDNQNV